MYPSRAHVYRHASHNIDTYLPDRLCHLHDRPPRASFPHLPRGRACVERRSSLNDRSRGHDICDIIGNDKSYAECLPTYRLHHGQSQPRARPALYLSPNHINGYGSIPIPFEKAGRTPMWQSRQSSVIRRSVLLLAPRTAVVHFLVILPIAI